MTFYETRCNRLKHVVQRVTVAVNYSGNLLVIYLFIKSKRLRNPANSLVINLAFSDLGMMLSQFPIFIWNTFNGGVWSFGPLACQIYAATGSAFGMCSICTMAAIAYDRYNVIAKGVQSVRLTTGNFVLLRCSVSLLFSIPPPTSPPPRLIAIELLDENLSWLKRSLTLVPFRSDCIPRI